ncbi:glycosyltransferase family 2 protein [Geomonas anaerohicana]|uniref:Glycosyltransferase family 2 protein n=1 Tax=Geomonas anaerohicana TaxID=2798583 RepID=A0ABS0YHS5_9BACT|nr:glycosyltransferase family 2 protein [Geomonas anaerohicana]MBJ6751457.1 glycosyltransferase family 2 protein [Geomonas anaerohicana]
MSVPALASALMVSVVVCTRNRSASLRRCLASLVAQSADASLFEVIVVDNASTDDTAAVARAAFAGRDNFRYCLESNLGLSHARNRGIAEAAAKRVAFIDDDAEACPDWIEEMLSFIGRVTAVVAFGGPYLRMVDGAVPAWFPPEYGSSVLSEDEGALDSVTQFISGTNMVFRRDVLLALGGFRPELGMSGTRLCYGEETRLQIDLKRQGHQVFYVPAMRVKHLLPAQKMKLSWLIRNLYAVGRCSSATFCQKRTLLSCCSGICYGIVFALRTLATPSHNPLRRKIYYSLKPLVSELGALHQFLLEGHDRA